MDQQPLERYRYAALPLPQQQFRLLTLKPNPDAKCAIQCELDVYDLPDFADDTIDHDDHKTALPPPSFEALSWCWGEEKRTQQIHVTLGNKIYSIHTTVSLETALKCLRRRDTSRVLWVDFVCINQRDKAERSMQVPQMNRIYGCAEDVCIWVGASDGERTGKAFAFMKELRNVWNTDSQVDKTSIDTLLAFWELLNRPWFSRRWVVQEIALARQAKLYCGIECIDWQAFGHAVSLFVEYEISTKVFSKRLNESIADLRKSRERYASIREPFGNASQLGAFVLIKAANSMVRSAGNDHSNRSSITMKSNVVPKLPLLRLEELVTKYTIFQAGQPRDTIYAYLAIAKDTTASTKSFMLKDLRNSKAAKKATPAVQLVLRALGRSKTISRKYRVDYTLPVVDVFQEFVEFSIHGAELYHALNILCCPWAPQVLEKHDDEDFHDVSDSDDTGPAAMSTFEYVEGRRPTRSSGAKVEEIALPSWIASYQEQPFTMGSIGAGEGAFRKLQRQNADPLAAASENGQYVYSANGSIAADLEKIKFEKIAGKSIMSVQGFIFDRIDKITLPSQLGNIPPGWFQLAGWDPTQPESSVLPEEFWRTLVANRGSDLGNTPPFYELACEKAFESLRSGGPRSLNTSELIAEGGSTIVTKFLERVQAVTWGKSLMRTTGDPRGTSRLGLVYHTASPGDYLCILYGCTVPVVLRKFPLDKQTRDQYQEQRLEQDKKDLEKACNKLREIRLQQRDSRRADTKFARSQKARRWFRRGWSFIAIVTWITSIALFRYVRHRRRLFIILGLDTFFSSLLATPPTEWKSLLAKPTSPLLPWIGRFAERADLFTSLFKYGLLLAWAYVSSFEGNVGRRTVRLFDEHLAATLCYVALARVCILSPLRGHTRYLKHCLRLISRPSRSNPTKVPVLHERPRSKSDYIDWNGVQIRKVKAPENHWVLVGPAYVHGMMDGEAIKWRNMINLEIAKEELEAKKDGRGLGAYIIGVKTHNFAERQTFHLR